MKSYLRALAFLTVIPLPFVRFEADGRELSQAAVYFPLAGATLGLALTGSAWLLLHLLPPAPVAVIALAAGFLLTRGLHLDGLADTADGLIGTTGREKAFKAMEDSATGVMGVVSKLIQLFLQTEQISFWGALKRFGDGSKKTVPAIKIKAYLYSSIFLEHIQSLLFLFSDRIPSVGPSKKL